MACLTLERGRIRISDVATNRGTNRELITPSQWNKRDIMRWYRKQLRENCGYSPERWLAATQNVNPDTGYPARKVKPDRDMLALWESLPDKPERAKRKVFPSGMIAHLWRYGSTHCDGRQYDGITVARNPQGNASFDGNEFYSYRTVIARRYADPHNSGKEPFIVISGLKYGNTTSGHVSDVASAFYGYPNLLRLPEGITLGAPFSKAHVTTLWDCKVALESYLLSRAEAISKPNWVKGWRTRPKELWEYEEAYSEYYKLAYYLGFAPTPFLANFGVNESRIVEFKERADRNRASFSNAASERYWARRGNSNRFGHVAYEPPKPANELLHAWLCNASNAYWPSHVYGHVVKRVKASEHIITSGGVQFPIRAIVALWDSVISNGNLPPDMLGPYAIGRVSGTRSDIGCHSFLRLGMASIALAIGKPIPQDCEAVESDGELYNMLWRVLTVHYGNEVGVSNE